MTNEQLATLLSFLEEIFDFAFENARSDFLKGYNLFEEGDSVAARVALGQLTAQKTHSLSGGEYRETFLDVHFRKVFAAFRDAETKLSKGESK